MGLKINLSSLVHYFLIYLMMLIPGSCLYQVYLGEYKYYIILGLYAVLAMTNKKYWYNYGILFSIVILAIVLLTRTIIGGVGLQVLLHLIVSVLCVQFAISYNTVRFLDRWINTVVFFSVISLVFWAIFIAFPSLIELWPAERYFVQSIGIGQWANDYYGKGLFLYSYLDVHPHRNCGIYTEPGVYQVVLNSALMVLLFWNNRLHYRSSKRYISNIIIIFLTIISCQSTTGYIAVIFIIGIYILFYSQADGNRKRTKKSILIMCLCCLIVLLLDYSFRGTESIIYTQLILKLFPDGSLDLSEGSGQYRMGMIIYSLSIIGRNPFGVGYDVFNEELAQGDVAASLVSFAAIYGIGSLVCIVAFLFIPIIKYERPIFVIMFVIVFINTTLAQTDLLYPAQIMFPLYLAALGSDMQKKRVNNYSYGKNINFIS